MGHYTSTLLVTLVCARLMTTTRLEPSGPPRLVSSHLLTTWTSQTEISPGLCRQLQVILVERSWRGDVVRTDCGLAGYDQCQLSSQLGLSLSPDIKLIQDKNFAALTSCVSTRGALSAPSPSLWRVTSSPREVSRHRHLPTHYRPFLGTEAEETLTMEKKEKGEHSNEVKNFSVNSTQNYNLNVEEEEKRRLKQMIRRILEIFLFLLITVSSILSVALLVMLRFC